MKIYTRTGDGGDTSLFGGARVPKAALRVEAYGTVDELNAHLGRAVAECADLPVAATLREIQSDLFATGSDLATPSDHRNPTRLDPARIAALEETIDRLEADLDPLKTFILPGGDPAAATLHIARTVCRRAERRTVALAAEEEIGEAPVVYLNRLSDLLFVMARWVNARRGVDDVAWSGS